PRRTPRWEPRPSRRARMPGPFALVGRPRRSSRLGEDGSPHPGILLARPPPQLEPLRRLRAVAGDDMLQLVPVGLGVLPDPIVALAQLGVGDGQAELPDLRHVAVEELLPSLLVALRLDPPDVHRIVVARDRVAVELHQWAPP